jgi:hypothetical protein
MGKKTVKAAAAIALFGTVLQFGGCIGSWFNMIWTNLPGAVLTEFLTDNDSVFDLFPD